MIRLAIGYPDAEAERAILVAHGRHSALEDIEAVTDAAGVGQLIQTARQVHVSEPIQQYVVALTEATRSHPDVHLGASPRASLMLMRASRALAAAEGRDFVLPDDVKVLTVPVLAHRLIISADAAMSGHTPESLLGRMLEDVPVQVKG